MSRARVVVPVLLVAGAAALLVGRRSAVDVIVVNTTAGAVRVQANDREVRLEPGERQRLDGLSSRLTVRAWDAADGGASLADVSTTCQGARTWVFSVAPVTTWWAISKGYGDLAHVGSSCEPFATSGPLFPLPEPFLPVVDEPMPLEVRVPKGVTGATKRGLWSDPYVARTWPRAVSLAVHSNVGATVQLFMDGQPLAELPHGSVAQVMRAPGPVSLRAVVADGPEAGKEFATSGVLDGSPPLGPLVAWVWDVDGSTRFHVVSRRYGRNPDDGEVPAARPFETASGLFRLPGDFHHEVDGDFPDRWHVEGVLKMLYCERLLERRRSPPPPPFMPSGGSGTPRRRADRPVPTTAGEPQRETVGEDAPFPPVPPDATTDAGNDGR